MTPPQPTPILGYEDALLAPRSNRTAWRVAVATGLVEGAMIAFGDLLGLGFCLGVFVSLGTPFLTAAATTYAAATHRIRFGFVPHAVAAVTAVVILVGLDALGSPRIASDPSLFFIVVPAWFVVLSIPGFVGSAVVIWNTTAKQNPRMRTEVEE